MIEKLKNQIILLFIVVNVAVSWKVKRDGVNFPWNYGDSGPDAWPHLSNNECDGEKQSPINIEDKFSKLDKALRPFKFTNYSVTSNWNLVQIYNGIQLAPDQKKYQIYETNLKDVFSLEQLHFHWGENIYQGSEHELNYKKFPLEMHLVHKSTSNPSKYTVLGFFFQISETDNAAYADLISEIGKLRNINDTFSLQVNLSSLLPAEVLLDKYYRYDGSLTTPPCTEGITWNVFSQPIDISKNQMKTFHSNIIKKNFRSPQPLNSRTVYRSFFIKEIDQFNHSRQISNSYFLMFFLLILKCLF